MAKAISFYRLCGFDPPAGAGDEPHVDLQAVEGFSVMLDTADTIRMMDPGWVPPAGGHRAALAMQCASTAEVDAAYDRVVAAGHTGHLAPFDAFWGQRYAVVMDPDGNPVDFYAPLPTP